MPISSIDNHRQTIGFYYHRKKPQCKPQVNIDIAVYKPSFLEQGRAIQQLYHVKNRPDLGRKNDKIIIKQMQASLLLKVAIILIALKPHHGIHNESLSSDKTKLFSSLTNIGNNFNPSIIDGNLSLIDIFPLYKPHATGKNTARRSCEAARAPRPKKSNRVRANAGYRAEESRRFAPLSVPVTSTVGSVKPSGVSAASSMCISVADAGRHGGAVPLAAKNGIGEAAPTDGAGLPRMSGHSSIHIVDIDYIPKITQFINPMKYFQLRFGHEKSDQYDAIRQQIKSNYRTENVCLRYFKDSDKDIPERFFYLKKNINIFRKEINKARSTVDQALLKLRRTTDKTKYGYLKYDSKNSIKAHLRKALDTEDNSILHQAMLRLEYYLLQLNKYFEEEIGNIIFATSNIKGAPSIPFQEPMLGFTMPMDSRNRIVIMVDYFNRDIVLNDRLKITALSDNSSVQIGTKSFIYPPKTRRVGDINEILEVFNEDMYAQGKEAFVFDDLFMETYGNSLDIDDVNAAKLIQVIKKDPALQKNIMMDNAHFMAKIIYDIAHYDAYEDDAIFPAGNEMNTDKGLSQISTKAILNLIIKQKGVA